MWAASAAVAGALIALIAWSFHQRWQLLAASPFPLGVDGYFYPVQLRALLERGELPYPTAPLAFYLLAPFAALTDPITGAKLGAALLGAAIAAPAYGVGARLGGGRGAGLVAAALATTSAGSAYLTVEFVKNGIGLTVALAALWLALVATARPGRGRIAAALVGLVAAYATHKMAAAIVIAVAVPAALAAVAERGALRGRRLFYAVAGVTLLAALALVLGALAPRRFLSPADAALAGGLVSSTPHWTAPALVFPSGTLQLGHDALLGLALAGIVVAIRVHRARSAARRPADTPARVASAPAGIAAAAWPLLVLAIAIGLPFLAVDDREGLGFRLRIAAFVPAALVAATALRDVAARLPGRDWVLAALAAALAVIRQPGAPLDGQIVTHPALVAAVQALNGPAARAARAGSAGAGSAGAGSAGLDHADDATLIVPERHIAFMVAWYTGAAIALRPDGIPPERRLRLLPLHFIRAGSLLERQLMAARAEPSIAAPIGLHPGHPNGLVLVAEPTWDWLLARLPPAERARLEAWPTT
jgi:hypothetical protein